MYWFIVKYLYIANSLLGKRGNMWLLPLLGYLTPFLKAFVVDCCCMAILLLKFYRLFHRHSSRLRNKFNLLLHKTSSSYEKNV